MNYSLDPIRPYLGVIKIALYVLLLSATFIGGCSHGEANKAKVIAAQQQKLHDAGNALRAAGKALREVNAEAERRIAADKQSKKDAAAAGKVAAAALQKLRKDRTKYAAAIERARRNPDCDALLNADLKKVCGL